MKGWGGHLGVQLQSLAVEVVPLLEQHHDNTAPVLPFYRNKGMLSQVDGMMSIEEVADKISEVLDS